MKILTKFNIVLLFVFSIGLAVAGYFSNIVLQKNARLEVLTSAGLLMDGALAIRNYTVKQIRPLLKPIMESKQKFLPQTVPAYAATQSFAELREKNPEYHYKEATVNPTNPRNKATDWENDLIQAFSDDRSLKEIIGERDTPTGPILYLARPISIKNEVCLSCHGVVEDAPASMLALYGNANGFGWKQNEIVGTQVVSVPMSVPIKKANDAIVRFMGSLLGIFVVIIILINIMLRKMIIAPVLKMAALADKVSHGADNNEEFIVQGNDEISSLGYSFERMRISLKKAMDMLK